MDKAYLSQTFCLSKFSLKNHALLDRHISLNHSHLYYDSDTKILSYDSRDYTIRLIGYILDIRDEEMQENDILTNLLRKYEIDRNHFEKELSFMNGRFIIIFDSEADTAVYSDATVMKPIFYWNNEILGSHEILIKEILNDEYEMNLNERNFRMNGFLDFTTTDNIFKFNPNLYFSFRGNSFKRFYPDKNIEIKAFDEIFNNTIQYYETQVKWLDNHYEKIYQSLTGGFDSKLSLAVNKPLLDKTEYFTYMLHFDKNQAYEDMNKFRKIYYKDKYIVERLVYNFNLNHRFFYFNDYKPPQEIFEKLSTHLSSKHSYPLSYLTDKEFEDDSIHLKSTLFELVKLNYSKSANKEQIVEAIKHWAPKEIRDDSESLLKMYEGYYERNHLNEAISKNINLLTLLYWEFRMGNWHSNITQETDRTQETFVFINNRFMLDQFMSLSNEDKKSKKYLVEVIDYFWPALNYFIPNSFNTLDDKR
ncbi:hypothetical protein [Salinicoccus albus]|uniref:hypothetical protein n=1 Tax=Salinicoccus albus TaxID=418756 RepID=UPI0012E9FD7F|nr:hypothetical protein [Salinicoccus albus]